MANLYVARRDPRKGLLLPMSENAENPSLLFPLTKKLERSELDELIRNELDKQGITKESDVQAIVDEAERQYEERVKVAEATQEVKRLMGIRQSGGKLMSTGYKKWKQAFYRPIK